MHTYSFHNRMTGENFVLRYQVSTFHRAIRRLRTSNRPNRTKNFGRVRIPHKEPTSSGEYRARSDGIQIQILGQEHTSCQQRIPPV